MNGYIPSLHLAQGMSLLTHSNNDTGKNGRSGKIRKKMDKGKKWNANVTYSVNSKKYK